MDLVPTEILIIILTEACIGNNRRRYCDIAKRLKDDTLTIQDTMFCKTKNLSINIIILNSEDTVS